MRTFLIAFAALALSVTSGFAQDACRSGIYVTDEQVVVDLATSFPNDNVYAFVGVDFADFANAVRETFAPDAEFNGMDEVFVSSGPSGGGGALLVFFLDGCFVSELVVPVNEFETVLEAMGGEREPVIVGGRGA